MRSWKKMDRRNNHECFKTEDIATIKSEVLHIRESQIRHDSNFTRLFNILEGNGTPGLKTQARINTQAIKRLWWFVGVCMAFVLGIVGKAFI